VNGLSRAFTGTSSQRMEINERAKAQVKEHPSDAIRSVAARRLSSIKPLCIMHRHQSVGVTTSLDVRL
jgi:hypothetical protein